MKISSLVFGIGFSLFSLSPIQAFAQTESSNNTIINSLTTTPNQTLLPFAENFSDSQSYIIIPHSGVCIGLHVTRAAMDKKYNGAMTNPNEYISIVQPNACKDNHVIVFDNYIGICKHGYSTIIDALPDRTIEISCAINFEAEKTSEH